MQSFPSLSPALPATHFFVDLVLGITRCRVGGLALAARLQFVARIGDAEGRCALGRRLQLRLAAGQRQRGAGDLAGLFARPLYRRSVLKV